MPPIVASFLTLVFVIFLFRWDRRNGPRTSTALWIPFCWLFIATSREVSEWFHLFGIPLPGGSLEEGNPVNRLFFITLIILGIRVLSQRAVTLSEIARSNVCLILFLSYCFVSVFWSDYPFVSLKRWIKVVGHPIMALIVLTEPNPQQAFVTLIKRCSFILVPVSVLFIKYFPEWGRHYDAWSGVAAYTGITNNKNMLGLNCLIVGFVLMWHLVGLFRWGPGKRKRQELTICLALFLLNIWLFSKADSKTPLVCLGAGLTMFYLCGRKWINHAMIWLYTITIAALLLVAQQVLGVYEILLRLLNRKATLTDRSLVWKDLLDMEINPLFGTGFESFWLGERLDHMWSLWAFKPNQAHNGYLETYLNLGIFGLILLVFLLASIFAKGQRTLVHNLDWGRFRLGFLIAVLLYNWTEAAFKTTHPIFFMLYIIAIDLPYRSASWAVNPEEDFVDDDDELHQPAERLVQHV